MRTPPGRIRILAAVLTGFVAIATLSGCAGGPGFASMGGDSWTVMTYVIADTNLEPYQADDLREQTKVGSRPGFTLISYVDRSAKFYDGRMAGQDDWHGSKTLKITQGGSDVLESHGNANTGDPDVLAGFIHDTVKNFPASHYALIINDHGSSWPGVGADGSFDDDSLSLNEVHQGITHGLHGTGIKKLDLMGFDACLMATYETASTLQDVADRLLASEELEPGYGWDYTALETAAQGGTVDELGTAIIDAYVDQSDDEGEQQVTLSLTDLTRMPAVDRAVGAFAESLDNGGAELAPTIGRSLSNSLEFGATPEYRFYMHDLGMLAEGVGGPEAEAVLNALDAATVDKMDGATTQGASGLAIYFPPQARTFDEGYADVASAATWTSFLDSYYASGISTGSAPAFASARADSGFDDGAFVIQQQLVSDPNQITDATIRYGYVEDDGSITLVGDEPANVDSDGLVSGFFDSYELHVSAGSQDLTFYSSYTLNESSEVATIGVPIAYSANGSGDDVSQAFLQLTYQPSTGTILSQTFYGFDEGAGAYSEIAPAKRATILPLKTSLAAEGGEQLFIYGDWSDALRADPDKLDYDYEALPSGAIVYAELMIQDAAGTSATSVATGTLP
ncbi:MAG TPA: clostripain-related cysteine peptidase [Pseudolysinimonas sp.]|nr:clostripain-related cysteine peptidase [Pseudolysinimonas sp.]